jgi:D-alanyl-D-alanine carboxypeptidase/D-alanyl-D-alanine-endopeptidase (penicillin-binding protein 4)
MCEPSLSLAAALTRWRSCPFPRGRRTARATATALAAALLAGCTVAGAGPAGAPDAIRPTGTASAGPAASPAIPPDPDALKARLAKVPRTGIGVSGIVVLDDTGAVVTGRGADRPLAPASTLKLLTSLAAVDTLGADHTFTTRVVSPAKGRIVLVGGGDPLLTDKASASPDKPASLQRLAADTAAALAASGVKKVRLGYDDTLFAGPDFSPAWKASWRGYLSRVAPLMVGEGRFDEWRSDPQPGRTAAQAFAARLKKLGVTVTGVRPEKASASASPVASVSSAPLSAVVGRTLRLSDNLAAEVLARQVALGTGAEPSFAGATASITTWLKARDLWADGMRLVDGSGLSDRSRVTATVLARAIALSLATPSLGAVAAGLPVAGRNGTLKHRFDDKSEAVARGNVHAKTGTIVGVASLAGYLTTADGARLVFAEIANRTSGQNSAYNWLDRSAAAMVRCGCR